MRRRACTDDKFNQSIACTAAHDQELRWVIDTKAVYGTDFLTGAKLTDLADDLFNKMLQACVDPYNQSGRHLTDTTGTGTRFFSDVPTTGTTLPITCVLASTKGESLGDRMAAYDF